LKRLTSPDRAAGETREVFHVDRMHERVGMAMDESPSGLLAAEHQGHTQ
jgi:hypothetical protein